MKESFGSTFMFAMIMIILVIFVAFMSITLNFARAFRVKNGVIDIIEQYEGINNVDTYNKISNYIDKMGYSCKSDTFSNVTDYVINDSDGLRNGYGSFNDFDDKKIYDVQVCVTWNIPLVNINDTWKFTGKTELIGGGVIDLER